MTAAISFLHSMLSPTSWLSWEECKRSQNDFTENPSYERRGWLTYTSLPALGRIQHLGSLGYLFYAGTIVGVRSDSRMWSKLASILLRLTIPQLPHCRLLLCIDHGAHIPLHDHPGYLVVPPHGGLLLSHCPANHCRPEYRLYTGRVNTSGMLRRPKAVHILLILPSSHTRHPSTDRMTLQLS